MGGLEASVVFILRCIFWLGLVFSAMPWNAGPDTRGAPAATPASAAAPASAKAAKSGTPGRPQRPASHFADDASRAAVAAAWKFASANGGTMARSIAAAVEEKCLAAPRDCLQTAQRLQGLLIESGLSEKGPGLHGGDTLNDADRVAAPLRR